MSVRQELEGLGSVKLLGDEFNQDRFQAHDVTQSANLTSGFCAGVVLDWARRVLQSGADRDKKYLSYSTPGYKDQGKPGVEKKEATMRRMAAAYEGRAPTYVAETNKVQGLKLLTELEQAQEKRYSDGRVGVPVFLEQAQLLQCFWDRGPVTKFNLRQKPAGILTKAEIVRLKKDLEATEDGQFRARSADGRHWESFAAQLDEILRERQRAKHKEGDPKRLFGYLTVVKSSPQRIYPEEGNWMAELRQHGFLLYGCTIISLNPENGESGHQVAVHQTGQDQFVLFDPNYGAFQCSREKLAQCIQHLFWDAVKDAPKSVLDGHKAVYRRRKKDSDPDIPSWRHMGYTVFQKKAA